MNQPSDVTVQTAHTKTTLKWNPSFGSKKTQGFTDAQKFVDSECLRYMDPLTPWRTGSMVRSAIQGTAIGSGHIIYNAVYARRQYYEHKSKGKWFETMKSQHLQDIKEGAAKRVEGNS